jgi:hypothetical protein
MKKLAPWKIAALASSIALGAAFVGYRAWSAPSPKAPPPEAAPSRLPQIDIEVPSPQEFFAGSKSMMILPADDDTVKVLVPPTK